MRSSFGSSQRAPFVSTLPGSMPCKKRPAAVAEAGDNGAGIGKAAHQSMKRKLKAMSEAGREFPLKDYQAQKSWPEKRAWWTKFTLDEQCSWLSIKEDEYMKQKEVHVLHSGPMYLWDVAKLNGCAYDPKNKALTSSLLSLVADCPSYPADSEELRKQGHLMYDYSKRDAKRQEFHQGRAMHFGKEADVNAEEFNTARGALTDAAANVTRAAPKRKAVKASASSGSTPAASSDMPQFPKGPKKDVYDWCDKTKALVQKEVDMATDVTTMYEMQQDKAWFSKKNLKILMTERKAIDAVMDKLKRQMLIHQMSCPETFESKQMKDFQNDIMAKVEKGMCSECKATSDLLKFKGVLA